MTNALVSILNAPNLLRRALMADAVVSGATGLLLAVGADPLSGLLGLHPTLLRVAGVGLLPFAALLVWLARRESIPRGMVWAVIACNLLWTVESLALLVGGWVSPTALGYVFVVGQALVVATFAELQWFGLRRA